MKSTLKPASVVWELRRRKIPPDKSEKVFQGTLNLWYVGGLFAVALEIGTVAIAGGFYLNTYTPQEIADDVYASVGGNVTVAQVDLW